MPTAPATIPCFIAHGPPVPLMLIMLMLFLALGAVLPPCIFLRKGSVRAWGWKVFRILLATVLNIYGFLVYCNGVWVLYQSELYEWHPIGIMLPAIGMFIAVEICVFHYRFNTLKPPRA